jgi:adenylate kinase
MNCVIFGAPGSGKGTQAAALCEAFQMVHVSTGDMLREAVRNGTELGKKAQALMADGKLVPDELVGGIVREKILNLVGQGKGILFDGYPRNLDQAKFLDACLTEAGSQIDAVAVLDLDPAVLVKRICGRRLCTKPGCTGAFNIHFMPSKQEGVCDLCCSPLQQRKDDNEETLKERLAVYNSQSLPSLEYYDQKDLLIRVNADDKVESVRAALLGGIRAKCGCNKGCCA